MKSRRALAILGLGLAAGCLFPSLATLTVGEADAGDAATDTALAAKDAQPQPIVVDDFEQGCDPWVAQNGTLAMTSTAHGGKSACIGCKTAGGTYFTIDHGGNAFAQIKVGVTYTGYVWVRVAPQTTNTGLLTVEVLRTIDGVGGYAQQSPFDEVPIDQNWQRIATTMVIDAGVTISGYVGLDNYVDGDCFILDDFELYEGDGG